MVRSGLISDTHGLLRPEGALFLRGCDHIVHAGDVGRLPGGWSIWLESRFSTRGSNT